MTPQEFKAWFEGYSEGIEEKPTLKQWVRIRSRVAEIDGKSTTYPVFVDRYWPTYYNPIWVSQPASPAWALPNAPVWSWSGNGVSTNSVAASYDTQTFSVGSAFTALGKADAQLDS